MKIKEELERQGTQHGSALAKKRGPAPARPLCPRGSRSDGFLGPLQASASS